jgi:DNA-binding LacI/PurR family transcriptional regulator
MQHVAKASGVSKMTVSLALRNHPSIPKKTRTRILAQARRLGYNPNPLVAALMSNLRSLRKIKAPPTIAFVTTNPKVALGSGTRRLLAGAQHRARQLGYQAELFSLSDLNTSPKRLSAILEARGIRAVVLAPFPAPVSNFDFSWSSFACAAIARSLLQPELHRAHSNQYHAVLLAFARVWAAGYRRIAFVAENAQSNRTEHWWRNGFRLAWERHGGRDADCLVYLPDKIEERAALGWYREVRPEAILSIDVQMLHILRNSNVSVPEEVGYAVLDLQDESDGCAGIDQNHGLIAAAAVDIVVEQLQNNELGVPLHPKAVMIEGNWTPGRTILARSDKRTAAKPRAPRQAPPRL